MATEVNATGKGLVPYRLTVRQFERMIDAGIFPEGAHLELLGGVLVDKMTKNDPHDFVVGRLGDALRASLAVGFIVREEKSLRLGRWWRPEPDLAVVRGRWEDFSARAPRVSDVALLVEVADTTYAKDRGVKWHRYAAAGIPAYWIVNLLKRQIEVFGNPAERGRAASYHDAASYGLEAVLPVEIDGREVGRFAARDLLP